MTDIIPPIPAPLILSESYYVESSRPHVSDSENVEPTEGAYSNEIQINETSTDAGPVHESSMSGASPMDDSLRRLLEALVLLHTWGTASRRGGDVI